jgi:hypothetical protein
MKKKESHLVCGRRKATQWRDRASPREEAGEALQVSHSGEARRLPSEPGERRFNAH